MILGKPAELMPCLSCQLHLLLHNTSPGAERSVSYFVYVNISINVLNDVYLQGILLNDDIGLDWVFKNSIILDIVMVSSSPLHYLWI